MRFKVVLFILALIVFGLLFFINLLQAISNLKVNEYDFEPNIKLLIYGFVLIILIVSFIKKKYFIIISIICFLSLIGFSYKVINDGISDCGFNYVYKIKLDTFSNKDTSLYIIAIPRLFNLRSDKKFNFLDSINRCVMRVSVSDTEFTDINLPILTDLSYTLDTLKNGEGEIKLFDFCCCEGNTIAKVKRVKKYPIRLYRNGYKLLDTIIDVPITNVFNTMDGIVVDLGKLKIYNTP